MRGLIPSLQQSLCGECERLKFENMEKVEDISARIEGEREDNEWRIDRPQHKRSRTHKDFQASTGERCTHVPDFNGRLWSVIFCPHHDPPRAPVPAVPLSELLTSWLIYYRGACSMTEGILDRDMMLHNQCTNHNHRS